MGKQSRKKSSLSIEPMVKAPPQSENPSGLQTPPAMPNESPQEAPKKNNWRSESPDERLEVANDSLREALARFQSLGCLLYTKNVDGLAVIRLTNLKFSKPGSNDPTLELTVPVIVVQVQQAANVQVKPAQV